MINLIIIEYLLLSDNNSERSRARIRTWATGIKIRCAAFTLFGIKATRFRSLAMQITFIEVEFYSNVDCDKRPFASSSSFSLISSAS